jgi:hypothetical protein
MALLKDLGEFGIFEIARKFYGSTTHLRRKIIIVASAKKRSNLVIFQLGFVANLPWDPNEWTWKMVDGLSIAPFFIYSAKRHYKGNKTHYREAQSFVFK